MDAIIIKYNHNSVFTGNIRFAEISGEFIDIEIKYIINQIKKRTDIDVNENNINDVSVNWMIEYLTNIEHDLTDSGALINHIILTKIKMNSNN